MKMIRANRSFGILSGLALALYAASGARATQDRPQLGVFAAQSDIGLVTPPGDARYSAASDTYTLTGAGANTWYHVDDFHYLWKRMSGDVALTAEIRFPPVAYRHEPDPHRKGILMFRQTLDSGGIYADAVVHGSGVTALQYRRERGANSEDIELNIDAPQTVRIEKRGDAITLYLSMKGEPLHAVGASIGLHLKGPFYVGLGVVSHDANTVDRVEFRQVRLQALPPLVKGASRVRYSTLRTIQTEDQYRRAMVIRTGTALMQSANWLPHNPNIYVYEGSHMLAIPYLDPAAGGEARVIDTGSLVDCSGNYGLSPDGRWLAVSCEQAHGGPHQVYVLPASGIGKPVQVSHGTQSFFHAWSPDSRTIAFTRGRASKADIFTVPATGGEAHQLTHDTINDGPDYSADGQFIYFDSSRSGQVQIWRMRTDGSAAEQITDDGGRNSSPHLSPDGKSLAFLAQPPGAGDAIGAAAIKVVTLSDGLIRTLTELQGNRDSFSMYGWGDNNHVAFISYDALAVESASARLAPESTVNSR
jgi:TolB protein